ncbi:hypothetical protein D5S19_16310 [Amycolatopsis panacis]|uniref:Uncharacterized protein n=1 Tax=Amycolatopsis panacis TaxID=2340917 RepID=A0A419I3G2_9PSEU|nr:hypothetical protein D5S19_16310 [Amycolatopsis panacis]
MQSTFSGNLVLGEMNGVKVVNEVQAALEHLNADDDYLNLTLQLFAPPEGFDSTYAKWRDGARLLTIARQPGTGRTVIAHAMLATLRRQSRQQVKVGALHFGGGETFPVDRLPAKHRRWAYVVEVPPDEEGFRLHSRLFRMTLTQLAAELERRESWLIFLISPEQWAGCVDEDVKDMEAEIGAAVPADMVRKALRFREPELDVTRWLEAKPIQRMLDGRPPAEVLEIVELIRSAHRANPDQLVAIKADDKDPDYADLSDGGDRWFARRVQTVVEAKRNWRKPLLEWHRKQERTSVQRSFLLAAAALPGAPGSYVYALASKLEGTLSGQDQPGLAALDAPGIIELVDAVEADLSDNDTVVFRHDGWDDAALHYFWTDRPFSRAAFMAWLADAPTDTHGKTFDSVSSDQLQELAARIARFAVHWAVRQERPEPLGKLADTWHDSKLWPVFVAALDEAATQSSTHRYIHTMLLKWAKRKDLALWRAVAEVCGLEFGRRHTGKALRRLRHVAVVADEEIAKAVERSVITLWDDTSVRETLFETVIAWCKNVDTAAVAYRAFSALAAKTDENNDIPTLLARRDDVCFTPSPDGLTAGWTVLLSPQASKEAESVVHATVHQWLDVAMWRSDLRDEVLGLLRKAVDHPEQPGVVSPREHLRHYVFTWHESGDGSDTAERERIYLNLTKLFDGDFSRRLRGEDPADGTDHAA